LYLDASALALGFGGLRRFDSPRLQDYNNLVHFLIRLFLPIFKYLFFAGMIGSVPVIIITAIKTAESMLEEDSNGQKNSAS
jgi:hypothetical protein